ncbi:MAG: hypothetical protein DHS20C13_26190 [Thermodesulfobacteriota bacterium]|nr:MAG: hypothetical protein DHS20C13_26190 [Thermodesulfobacteriota bacterium]
MFTCTKGTDDNVCEECISHFEDDDEIDSAEREEYSYLTNSRCCALGYYFDDEGDRCSEIENPNCLYLDNGKCQVCELGYQLFKERDTCCPTGTYPEDDGVCVSS